MEYKYSINGANSGSPGLRRDVRVRRALSGGAREGEGAPERIQGYSCRQAGILLIDHRGVDYGAAGGTVA